MSAKYDWNVSPGVCGWILEMPRYGARVVRCCLPAGHQMPHAAECTCDSDPARFAHDPNCIAVIQAEAKR